MKLNINGTEYEVNNTLSELKNQFNADVTIINGFQTDEDIELKSGDNLVFIQKGKMPDRNQFEAMLSARHTPKLYEKFKSVSVGVAGLGGLGSNIAVMLAQSGIGKLVIADFDMVEPSNLNRQHYSISHLGMTKAEAVKQQIADINPYVEVISYNVRIDISNASDIFGGCDILCEAFDNPANKAMLISAMLSECPNIKVVSGSGMAGIESSNTIITKRRFKNLYICGDGETEAKMGRGLMAPRVAICAGHQANMVLRLASGEVNP